mgnify:CR=1 FL=1
MKPFDGSSKGPQRDSEFGAGRVPDELIDAILDGEVGPTDSKALFEQLRSNPDAAGDLNATRRAIGVSPWRRLTSRIVCWRPSARSVAAG